MLYKYTGWNENTKDNLVKGQLWFNTPDNFNDPFDTLAYYSLNNNEAINNIRSSMGDKIGGFEDSNILEVQRLTEYEEGYHKRYGITCFSCNEVGNILLWSHYADKHKGICLGFEVGDSDEHAWEFMPVLRNESFSSRLLKMKYVSQKQRPMQNDNELLLKKFDIWNYEEEYRVMIRSENLEYFPAPIKYKRDKLKKIILGARFQIGWLSELMDCLNSYDVDMMDFEVALLDDSEYKLHEGDLPLTTQRIIHKNINDSVDVKYEIYLANSIENLRKKYPEDVIKKAWNNAFKHIQMYVCQKFFPMIQKGNFWEKAGEKNLPKNEGIEIGQFRSYMEKRTKLEADTLLKDRRINHEQS